MKKFLRENKFIVLIFTMLFGVLIYSALQTLITSDDLPYSLFYRGEYRITHLSQIIANQESDYLTINGRFLVHCVVQFMLMFGKNLFAVVNAICIITTLIFVNLIVKLYTKKSSLKDTWIYMLIISLFLLLASYKYCIYWVAGSVNYMWVFMLLIIFIYYYLRLDLNKYRVLNAIIIFILSSLHEASFVLVLFIIIGDSVYNYFILKQRNKNFYIVRLIYILFSIIGGLIILKAPGNQLRMSTAEYWYSMSFLKRISISIPVVSQNLYNFTNIDNVIPTIFVTLTLIYNYKKKIKFRNILSVMIVLFSLIAIIFNSGWLYFVVSVLMFLNICIINYQEDNNELSVIWLSLYAVVFSMIITPEFGGKRPNYYMYIFMIINIIIYLKNMIQNKNALTVIKVLSIVLLVFTMTRETIIFYNIGVVKRDRKANIALVKENNLEVMKCKKISDKYASYQADGNTVCSDDYWANRYFKYYYELPEKTKIELVD